MDQHIATREDKVDGIVAQTRVESGVHSALEVSLGAILGALTALVIFQLA